MSTSSFHDSFTPDDARARAADAAWPDSSNGHKTDWYQPKHAPVAVVGTDAPPDMAWADRAACIGRIDEMFVAPEDVGANSNSPAYRAAISNAVAICSTCPVFDECDQYAHHTLPAAGVWAGKRWDAGRVAKPRKRPARVEQNHAAAGSGLLSSLVSATWGVRP